MKKIKKEVLYQKKCVVVGIDPGTTRIGVGIVEKINGTLLVKEAKLLIPDAPAKKNEGEQLLCIELALKKILRKHTPDVVGVERLFFSKNQKTAFSVAHARGVILKTVAEMKTDVVELTPNQIKLAVTGRGNASKDAVAKMVEITLKISAKGLVDDITDALAVAIATPFFRPRK